MRSRALLIEFSRCHFSALGSFPYELHHFLLTSNTDFNQPINVDLSVLCLFQLQICFSSKHINYLFFVEFCHRALDVSINLMILLVVEDIFNASINQPWALDCLLSKNSVCFSWTCLSVCKDGSVIAFKHSSTHGGSNVFKDGLLTWCLTEYLIKTVVIFIYLQGLITFYMKHILTLLFFTFHWLYSDKNFDIFFFFRLTF